jgi:hypothetical protein
MKRKSGAEIFTAAERQGLEAYEPPTVWELGTVADLTWESSTLEVST